MSWPRYTTRSLPKNGVFLTGLSQRNHVIQKPFKAKRATRSMHHVGHVNDVDDVDDVDDIDDFNADVDDVEDVNDVALRSSHQELIFFSGYAALLAWDYSGSPSPFKKPKGRKKTTEPSIARSISSTTTAGSRLH